MMTWILFLIFCFSTQMGNGGPSTPSIKTMDTRAYLDALEKIQKNEECPTEIRELAAQAMESLTSKKFRAALRSLERIILREAKSDEAFTARMILLDLSIRMGSNSLLIRRQFLNMPEIHKEQAVNYWLKHQGQYKREKLPAIQAAFARLFSIAGQWAQRRGDENAEAIQRLAAEVIPKNAKGQNAQRLYNNLAKMSQSKESREEALFELADSHLALDRFSRALAAVRKVLSPESRKRRYNKVIEICKKNPDSQAAIRQLKQEQTFCPAGPMRIQFDIALAHVFMREENYKEAEKHLMQADAQYTYTDVLPRLKERYKTEKESRQRLRKRIGERVRDLAKGKTKP